MPKHKDYRRHAVTEPSPARTAAPVSAVTLPRERRRQLTRMKNHAHFLRTLHSYDPLLPRRGHGEEACRAPGQAVPAWAERVAKVVGPQLLGARDLLPLPGRKHSRIPAVVGRKEPEARHHTDEAAISQYPEYS